MHSLLGMRSRRSHLRVQPSSQTTCEGLKLECVSLALPSRFLTWGSPRSMEQDG